MTIIVSLVGQQPIPNLLPIRHIKPRAVLLVYSDFTQRAAEKLTQLVEDDLVVWPLLTEAYAITNIRDNLINKLHKEQAVSEDIIFNVTGGTKPMSLAAYLVASEKRAPFVYLQSEGKRSRLYHYTFDKKGELILTGDDILSGLITADDYLLAYVNSYKLTGFAKNMQGGLFERAIHDVLASVVDEILIGAKLLGALDVDFVVRCDNQVGIIEAKTGKGVKKGLDQLNTAGGQQYLGTYTQKFLVSDQVWDHTRSNLRELAGARRIKVIELPSYGQTGKISTADAHKLRFEVCEALGRKL